MKPSLVAPDGFIVFSHAGDDFASCKDYVRQRLGLPDDAWRNRAPAARSTAAPRSVLEEPDDKARIARAVAIWDEGRDPRATLVESYLASRGLPLDETVALAALRYHPSCPWRENDRTIRVPAMIAAMRQIDGNNITAVHRTRLTPDGAKVDRRMLGIAAGTAIKLDPDEVVTQGLVAGEGIETTLAGRLLGFRPAWAMGMAGGITKLPVLGGVEALTILTERDESGTNQRAVSECGQRWHEAGREVILIEPKVGKDVNDAIRGAA